MSYAGQTAGLTMPLSNALVDLPPITIAARRLTFKAPHCLDAEIMSQQSDRPQELPSHEPAEVISQLSDTESYDDQPGVTADGKIDWDCMWGVDEQPETKRSEVKTNHSAELVRNTKRLV